MLAAEYDSMHLIYQGLNSEYETGSTLSIIKVGCNARLWCSYNL
jgi:hypothetical protein